MERRPHGSPAELPILSEAPTASAPRYVMCTLRPHLDAPQHPTLHQKGANQPERIRQEPASPGRCSLRCRSSNPMSAPRSRSMAV